MMHRIRNIAPSPTDSRYIRTPAPGFSDFPPIVRSSPPRHRINTKRLTGTPLPPDTNLRILIGVMVKLLVFLGNPGRQYERTRHNAGWLVCDNMHIDAPWQQKFHGIWSKTIGGAGQIRLLKPQTYMNESGLSVAEAAHFFGIGAEGILVVHDDLELPFGTIRMQNGGGLQGHNGLRSIRQHLGTDQFFRLRIGIGRPARGDISSFVLSKFSPDEEIQLPLVLDKSVKLIQTCTGNGLPSLPHTETLP